VITQVNRVPPSEEDKRRLLRGYLTQVAFSVSDIVDGIRKRMEDEPEDLWRLLSGDEAGRVLKALDRMESAANKLYEVMKNVPRTTPEMDSPF
jgi:hypothetical protein